VKNHYPLPLISSAFELLQGVTVLSKLDLQYTYQLVQIWEGDEWKNAFNTASGHYEYLVMPFGLTNAPAVVQALVNDVLCDMLNRFVDFYQDDIFIFSRSTQEPFPPTVTTPEPETILPTSCLVTALIWGIGKQVREASVPAEPWGALITRCLWLTLSAMRSWRGPATRDPIGPWPSCDNGFGGLRWFQMSPCLSPPARSVLRIRLLGSGWSYIYIYI
jgi:hypothetical protein